MSFFNFSVDTEYYGFSNDETVRSILEIASFSKKNQIKTTFFVEGKLLENNHALFKDLEDQGFEIASHSYDHIPFDNLSQQEIMVQLNKSKLTAIKLNLKNFNGFRAPQHSIRKKHLYLVKKAGFNYDSSITSLNKWQFLFFPKRFVNSLQHFFSKPFPHFQKDLKEIPPSSFGIPMVAMTIRIFPLWFNKLLFLVCKKLSKGNVLFYIHSWDFLELPNSKVYRYCPKEKFLKKLTGYINFINKHSKPVLLKDV